MVIYCNSVTKIIVYEYSFFEAKHKMISGTSSWTEIREHIWISQQRDVKCLKVVQASHRVQAPKHTPTHTHIYRSGGFVKFKSRKGC